MAPKVILKLLNLKDERPELTLSNLDTLHKTEVTGIKDVDNVQRGVGDTVADTLAPGHIGGVAGGAIDKHILRGNV